MRLIACIKEPNVAKGILEHLGLRAELLPTLRAASCSAGPDPKIGAILPLRTGERRAHARIIGEFNSLAQRQAVE